MRKFDAAFFDLDGTLLDTKEFIYQAFEYTLEKHGFPAKARKDITPLMGKHIRDIYTSLAPSGHFETLFETHAAFQMQHVHLFSHFTNTKPVLKKLQEKGVKIAAITNRYRTPKRTLEKSGIFPFINLLITGDDVKETKPHPEAILKALQYFNITKNKAVMVGDSPVDIEAGKNAHVATIGVTYGFHGKSLIKYKPDYLVDDIVEILPIILKEKV